MTLQDVKTKLGFSSLNLSFSTDAQGNKTEWLTDWDDSRRIRVTIHQDTVSAIRKKPGLTNLAIQTEERTSNESGLPYTMHRIILFKETDYVL